MRHKRSITSILAILSIFSLLAVSFVNLAQSEPRNSAIPVPQTNIYMKLGDFIVGSVEDTGFEGWVALKAYQVGGTGDPVRGSLLTEFLVLKYMDDASAEILQAFLSQTIIEPVTLVVRQRIGSSESEFSNLFTYVLTHVKITSLTQTTQLDEDGNRESLETLSLSYETLTYSEYEGATVQYSNIRT